LSLNLENALFLLASHYFYLQEIIISFEDVDFYAKLSLILDIPVRNSITQWTIIFTVDPLYQSCNQDKFLLILRVPANRDFKQRILCTWMSAAIPVSSALGIETFLAGGQMF